MEVERDARWKIVPRAPKDILACALPTGVVEDANILSVKRVHKVAQTSVKLMGEVRGAYMKVVQKGLKEAHPSARHMVEENAAHSKLVAQRACMVAPSSV